MKLRLALASMCLAGLGLAGLATAATPPPTHTPAIHVVKTSPFTLQGLGFKAHASLKLVVHAGPKLVTRHATAGSTGAFVTVFPTGQYDPCSGVVTVILPNGQPLTFKLHRMCASLNPG